MRSKRPRTFCRILFLSPLLVSLGVFSSDLLPVVRDGFDDRAGPIEPTVRIGVLGLFDPQQFILSASEGQALVLRSAAQTIVLENSGTPSATVKIEGSQVVVTCGAQVLVARAIQVAARANQSVDFILGIPGKITRRYHGSLEIKPASRELSAIVTIDLETAVASVVAAEYASDTPLEALKANAIAARSYFLSGRRHHEFDFCDTTHCQFLRTPPPSDSLPAKAVAETRGLILSYQGRSFAAMYTRSCSGRTHIPAEVGLPHTTYPYYAVACSYCRLHPAHWTSRISSQEAPSLRADNENLRLAIDHRLGWSAVPSNNFTVQREGDSLLLRGVGNGHGIGLCQAGAKAMAEAGAGYQEILDHYYPNANIVSYLRSNRP